MKSKHTPISPKPRGNNNMHIDKAGNVVITRIEESRALSALKRAESACWGRAAAYIIINKTTGVWGKVKVAYPAVGAGPLRVWLWSPSHDLQYGKASGYGYDKLAAAMSGMRYDNLTFGNHCEGAGEWRSCLEKNGYEVIQAL